MSARITKGTQRQGLRLSGIASLHRKAGEGPHSNFNLFTVAFQAGVVAFDHELIKFSLRYC